jgi:hypothetical protein
MLDDGTLLLTILTQRPSVIEKSYQQISVQESFTIKMMYYMTMWDKLNFFSSVYTFMELLIYIYTYIYIYT